MGKKHQRFVLITEQADIEQVILLNQIHLGKDLERYKNHVYRMYNYAAWYLGYAESEMRKLAIAAVFHDLAIWTHHTFDYLGPSQQLAMQYLQLHHLPESWHLEVGLIIERHHQLQKYVGVYHPTVEAFRKAVLADLTFGYTRGKMPFAAIQQATLRFPYLGFQGRLVRFAARRFLHSPLNPLPMLRWGN